MNYLDVLSDNVKRIIDRKLKEAYIIERRIKRKENRKRNRELKEIADRKRDISQKYTRLYLSMKTRNQYKYCYKLFDEIKEKYGNNLLQTELNIGYENPFVIATILIDGKIIITKFE